MRAEHQKHNVGVEPTVPAGVRQEIPWSPGTGGYIADPDRSVKFFGQPNLREMCSKLTVIG
jgi:hypothetical protein